MTMTLKEAIRRLKELQRYARGEITVYDTMRDDDGNAVKMKDMELLADERLRELVLLRSRRTKRCTNYSSADRPAGAAGAAKDRLTMTAPVGSWLEQNQAVVKGLERLLGEIRKAEKSTENRVYIPRVRR